MEVFKKEIGIDLFYTIFSFTYAYEICKHASLSKKFLKAVIEDPDIISGYIFKKYITRKNEQKNIDIIIILIPFVIFYL